MDRFNLEQALELTRMDFKGDLQHFVLNQKLTDISAASGLTVLHGQI